MLYTIKLQKEAASYETTNIVTGETDDDFTFYTAIYFTQRKISTVQEKRNSKVKNGYLRNKGS